MIVVDTDVITYLTLPVSARSRAAKKAYAMDAEWTAPILWHYEYTNVLWQYTRRGHITRGQAQQALSSSKAVVQTHRGFVSQDDVLQLALDSDHATYDCFYAALAERMDVVLVTGDKQVARDFPDVSMLLENFAEGRGR